MRHLPLVCTPLRCLHVPLSCLLCAYQGARPHAPFALGDVSRTADRQKRDGAMYMSASSPAWGGGLKLSGPAIIARVMQSAGDIPPVYYFLYLLAAGIGEAMQGGMNNRESRAGWGALLREKRMASSIPGLGGRSHGNAPSHLPRPQQQPRQ